MTLLFFHPMLMLTPCTPDPPAPVPRLLPPSYPTLCATGSAVAAAAAAGAAATAAQGVRGPGGVLVKPKIKVQPVLKRKREEGPGAGPGASGGVAAPPVAAGGGAGAAAAPPAAAPSAAPAAAPRAPLVT
jgi:hypothetical protein